MNNKGPHFRIVFYRTESGDAPVERFLDQLEVRSRRKALDSLALLEEFGNRLREPYSKAVGDGIFELRIRFAGDAARIFYFFFVGNQIVLTNGFVKKTMKTPKRELQKARTSKADYERRMRHE